MEIISSLWTFPAIILAALLIAWAAECGQFFISQGLALAVLAWVQTLPEFAVEGVIALGAAQDPSKLHLITANYTGSLRLFVGLGWPMVYFVSFFSRRVKGGGKEPYRLELDDEHCVAVISLLPALLYFLVVYFKGTLNILDGIILSAIYLAYIYLLSKIPPHDSEEVEDLGRIPKQVMRKRYPLNLAWIISFFILGAALLYFSARPFLNSMLTLAVYFGISQFVFVQWVAPFLSEFPEKLSAFYWARKTNKAAMALANFVSSSINQWTILMALIPFIYSFGMGKAASVVFDGSQKTEILLTVIQSYLGFVFLASMDLKFFEAAALFLLWLAQFIFPGIRQEITWVYGVWALGESWRLIKNFERRNAFRIFGRLFRERLEKRLV
jgi:cation:H+ antiporter